jgi:hypothetical protein
LENTNLAEATCIGTDFSGARLTGACLRDWNIDHKTNLVGVKCDYFFMLDEENELGGRDRRPHETDAILSEGVFEKLFTEVRDTIELMIKEGGGRAAWLQAFRRLLSEYPEIDSDSNVSIKRVGDMTVIVLAAPPGIDKEGVSQTFQKEFKQHLGGTKSVPTSLDAAQALSPAGEGSTRSRRARVFISYCHKDEAMVIELKAHLSPHERTGLAEVWYDREILPGADWKKDVDQHLYDSDVVLLAISAEFISSHYCYERELAIALERGRRGEAVVVPIIFRDCDWKPLEQISSLQALPTDARPVESWPIRNEAWANVSRGLRKAIGDWRQKEGDRSA